MAADGVKSKRGIAQISFFADKEEVFTTMKMLLIYREQGLTGERLADTIARIGFDEIEAQLFSMKFSRSRKF